MGVYVRERVCVWGVGEWFNGVMVVCMGWRIKSINGGDRTLDLERVKLAS